MIGRLLHELLTKETSEGAKPQVIVVCNACTDQTASIARAAGAIVLETTVASKANALNIGDAAASHFPRFYIDADLVLTRRQLGELVRNLQEDAGVLAVTGEMRIDARRSKALVKAYFRCWSKMPYARERRLAGVIGLSEEGRRRFSAFPDAIADDLFLQSRFQEAERRIVTSVNFDARAPRRLGDLLGVLVRVRLGNAQLAASGLVDVRYSRHGARDLLAVVRADATLLPSAVAYAAVTAAAASLARYRMRLGDASWTRDESSRA